ncbi:hypothetical protein RCL_jg19441.t1 [Rhizophagus clarus]|uniref:DUF202 domain-containing protein n=1 Tax=Rhizophagus clarus TaxID=94130 RepID=A0A8H3LMN6_9GLOM|nr:hypothetical protein RCL_jg19441.t1 [Rhizophagus clarus]
MPSPTGNVKQPQTRLTNRRSFGSADSNYSSYDLDNVIETPDGKKDKKNKGILNNNSPQINSDNNNNVNNNDDSPKSLWGKFNPSLTLENKASVARDHLANERTFLAWLRTSLSFISIGIAITQLFRLSKLQNNGQPTTNEYDKGGKLLGIIFIILGIVFLSFGITSKSAGFIQVLLN